jgi:hypothetical protein
MVPLALNYSEQDIHSPTPGGVGPPAGLSCSDKYYASDQRDEAGPVPSGWTRAELESPESISTASRSGGVSPHKGKMSGVGSQGREDHC